MRAWIYRNLHRKVWSVLEGGQAPVEHFPRVFLADVEFRVRSGGRERARREKRKNVHAFAIGTRPIPGADAVTFAELFERHGPPERVTYSPFISVPSFVVDGTELALASAAAVLACDDGALWAWGLRAK